MTANVNEIDWAAVLIRAAIATAPAAKPKLSICNGVAAELPKIFTHYNVLTTRRQAHFISQAIVEAAYFQTLEEYASGDQYDTRTDLGFTAARDGDGRTNKGFGIFQTTGPTNQRRALKKLLALGFLVDQDVSKVKAVLTQPKYAAWSAGIFWDDNRMNAIADRDPDGTLCGRQINRGNANSSKPANGEVERKKAFKAVWKELQNPRLLPKVAPVMVAAVDAGPSLVALAREVRRIDPAGGMVGGDPIDTTGMTAEQLAAFNASTVDLAQSMRDNPDMEPVTGQSYTGSATLNLQPAPGMDEDEHAAQVHAGLIPDAGPASPSTPLPAEPVAPGTPEALLRATQQRLRDRGFFGVGGADGQPEWMTVQGIAGFQAVSKLPVTGQLDKATMDAIWAVDAPSAPISVGRAMTEVSDLKGKSAIIDKAENVKTASMWQIVAGGGTAAVTAIMSGFSTVWENTETVRGIFQELPLWAWGIGVGVAVGGPAAYAYWKAQQVQAARVEDQRSGKTS